MALNDEGAQLNDGGYIDLDKEVFVDRKTGRRITNADAERAADDAERFGPPTEGEQPKSPVVTYPVPAGTRRRLDELSQREHRQASEVARTALEEYLERRGA